MIENGKNYYAKNKEENIPAIAQKKCAIKSIIIKSKILKDLKSGGKMKHHTGRRQLVCRGSGRKKFCVYLHRNKKGQITKVINVGRSIRADTRIRAKRRLFLPKHRGYGHLGDWR